MGNRATVIFWNGETKQSKREISPAVYLHWNGGPESVYAFLRELDRRGVRADQEYECARFVQLAGEFFTWSGNPNRSAIHRDGAFGLSLGVVNGPLTDAVKHLQKVRTDHGDNGFYLVNRLVGSRYGIDEEVDVQSDEWRPDPGFMRRFTECPFRKGTEERLEWGSGFDRDDLEFRLVEWSQDEVAQERKEADASDYRSDLHRFFLDLEDRAPSEPAEV